MPDLPQKKVGIVACSGEEMPEGTVTRLAALKVLEQLRRESTVTICLPLFLAGGEGDRAFARFYPTVALDGCEKRCAARGTELYSGKPAASVVVTDLVSGDQLGSARRLSVAGMEAVDAVADRVAETVDELLGFHWDRRRGAPVEAALPAEEPAAQVATCSCSSAIPVQKVRVGDQEVSLVALPSLFEQFRHAGRLPDDGTAAELMHMVGLYNPIPEGQEAVYTEAIMREYAAFFEERG